MEKKIDSHKEGKFTYETAIILGAGPVGLWSAIEMLANNFARNVVLLEKRFSFNPKLNSWADRAMVVQFHRRILSLSQNGKPTEICPYNVSKELNEQHRQKYADLDHMSIKNIQTMLNIYLSEYYSERFLMLEMRGMALRQNIPTITIGTGGHPIKLFNVNFNPGFILDATGYHSVFMNQMLGINFEGITEYGCALKITWPEHKMRQVTKKETEFHDCHTHSPFFAEGYSSVAEFSAPITGVAQFFRECGYTVEEHDKSLPFLENDKTPFSIKLSPFIRKIINSKNDKAIYDKAVNLFKTIRRGKLKGMDAFDFINELRSFQWQEANVLALAIRQTVNKNVTIRNWLYVELSG